MISLSGVACPGGFVAFHRHWLQRPLWVMLPSFSMEAAQGSWKTSVLIFFGSIPGPFQKEPVSLSKRLTFTIQSSFVNASLTLPAFALEQPGFIPQARNPVNFPLYISSNSINHDAFCVSSSFG